MKKFLKRLDFWLTNDKHDINLRFPRTWQSTAIELLCGIILFIAWTGIIVGMVEAHELKWKILLAALVLTWLVSSALYCAYEPADGYNLPFRMNSVRQLRLAAWKFRISAMFLSVVVLCAAFAPEEEGSIWDAIAIACVALMFVMVIVIDVLTWRVRKRG